MRINNTECVCRGKDRMQAASGYHEHWPQGRGIFVNDDKTKKFLLWINEGDHLRIISMQPGAGTQELFSLSLYMRLLRILETSLERKENYFHLP